jgi:hypothetical protein
MDPAGDIQKFQQDEFSYCYPLKAGGEMRTHDQSKHSSKAFDQSNQMHSMIPEETTRVLLNLFLYAENLNCPIRIFKLYYLFDTLMPKLPGCNWHSRAQQFHYLV